MVRSVKWVIVRILIPVENSTRSGIEWRRRPALDHHVRIAQGATLSPRNPPMDYIFHSRPSARLDMPRDAGGSSDHWHHDQDPRADSLETGTAMNRASNPTLALSPTWVVVAGCLLVVSLAGGCGVSKSVQATTQPVAPPAEPVSIRFRDVSESSGVRFRHCSGNSVEKYFPTANGSGVALFDYDGDGKLDLYCATTRNLPLDAPDASGGNKLYRGRGDGTFEDVTERSGAGVHGFTHGLAVGDVDNDGDPDLYLAGLGGNRLLLNQGDGTFRQAGPGMGAECHTWSSGAVFFDYDRDGDLDLYVTCYGKWSAGGEQAFCGDPGTMTRIYCAPQTITPERHFLFRNRGDATFEDVTQSAGVLRTDGRGLGVVAADVNGDGWVDLYVANDVSPHFLFLNRGDGTFEDISASSGASASESGQFQAGMGVDAEDVDGDGRPELFATHFREDYNTLYRNIDGRTFQDISAGAGILKDSLPDVGWGCALSDFDNDGWSDMLVVNGHVDDNLPQIGRDVPAGRAVPRLAESGGRSIPPLGRPGAVLPGQPRRAGDGCG